MREALLGPTGGRNEPRTGDRSVNSPCFALVRKKRWLYWLKQQLRLKNLMCPSLELIQNHKLDGHLSQISDSKTQVEVSFPNPNSDQSPKPTIPNGSWKWSSALAACLRQMGWKTLEGGRNHELDTWVSRPDGEIVEVEHLSASPHERNDYKTESPKQNLQIIDDEISSRNETASDLWHEFRRS